jgi:creatinine amidohydrolase
MLATPFVPKMPASARIRRVVATGIGSSEAQARYFAWLLNTFTDIPACFVPLAALVAPVGPGGAGQTLAVFSQGLSSNARFALDQAAAFSHTLVFTSATEAGQRAAGKQDRADLLARLVKAGAEVVPFPVEDEYAILIRIVGPACGFVAAHRFVETLPGSRLPRLAPQADALLRFADSSIGAALGADLASRADGWRSGGVILLPAPVGEFAQNVACKFVEGLFWDAPVLVEPLQLAHGPFQQLAAAPKPVWIFQGPTAADADLAARAVTMLRSIGIEPLVIPFPAAPALAPIALELLLDPVFADQVRRLDVDQVDWPGKGLDGPVYHLAGPSSAS